MYDVIRPPIETATEPADSGTPLTLPVDADVFAREWHLEHSEVHPAQGCPLCQGNPKAWPMKSCCGVLAGDVCDCAEFSAQARGVFANPIMCRPARQWGA